ncbi:hypothetical protein BH10PSE7_BH10PSE7_09610 [soil metagenome]
MIRRLASCFALFIFGAAPVLAQATCPDGKPRDDAKTAAMVDVYAANPFSARTWRVLKGLGDPMIEASYGGYSSWEYGDAFRKLAAGVAPDIAQPQYYGYDCRIGYPLEVLKKRTADLGVNNAYVRQWLVVQMAVLDACNGGATASLPAPMSLEGPLKPLESLQTDDRAYQQASLNFYKDKSQALTLYRAIGASASPHKAAARYMTANILANAKQLDEARNEARAILADPTLASVHGITQELIGYIANLEDTPQGWSDLLTDTIKVIETPAKDILASDKLQDDYARALTDIDYAGIRAKNDDWWLEGKLPADATISKAIVDAARAYPIVPWMIAGQTLDEDYDGAAWQYIGTKWQDRTQSYVTRALALTSGTPPLARDVIEALSARPDDASRKSLWDKVRTASEAVQTSCGVAPETAAAGILLRHAVRISALAGAFDEAYGGLEQFPFKASQASYGGTLAELGKYLMGQGMVEEGRRYRDRLLTEAFFAALPAENTEVFRDELSELGMWFAEDREHWTQSLSRHSRRSELPIVNFLPAKDLRAMSQDAKTFSEAERALFSRAAWTRVYAQGRNPDEAFTQELYTLNPVIKQSAGKTAADYPAAKADRQRLLTVLRNPRFNILVNGPGEWQAVTMTEAGDAAIDQYDHNDRNWWCPFEMDRQLGALRQNFDSVSGNATSEWRKDDLDPVVDPAIKPALDKKREAVLKAHPLIKAVSWKELAVLASMPSAPKRLTNRAIAWGKASKGDDGAPEALALAVRTTRYGCSWHGGHKAYSKPAQELLRTKFPSTTWASQTPYWFDCMNTRWDKDYNRTQTCDLQTWPKQKLPR